MDKDNKKEKNEYIHSKKEVDAFGDALAKGMVDGLNKHVMESVARGERYEKIYAIERNKWPHNMGGKLRPDIPEELYPILDECITKSQIVARDACQTIELTEKYLKENS